MALRAPSNGSRPCPATACPDQNRCARHTTCRCCRPQARRDSALLDGAIVELAVSRDGDGDEQQLAQLQPGRLVEVSGVLGKG